MKGIKGLDAHVTKKTNEEDFDEDSTEDSNESSCEDPAQPVPLIKEDEIEAITSLFQPNKDHYDTALQKVEEWIKVQARRFLLWARPQIGKTGVYMKVIEKFIVTQEMETVYQRWKGIQSQWQGVSSSELQATLQESAWKEYHALYKEMRSKWDCDIPFLHAATKITQTCRPQSHIADFGCGQANLGRILLKNPTKFKVGLNTFFDPTKLIDRLLAMITVWVMKLERPRLSNATCRMFPPNRTPLTW